MCGVIDEYIQECSDAIRDAYCSPLPPDGTRDPATVYHPDTDPVRQGSD